MKKVLLMAFFFVLFGCKKSNNFVSDKVQFNRIDSLYLKEFKAEDPKFSLLLFGYGYFDSELRVNNCEELKPLDSSKALKFGPFAKIYRIDNTCKTSFQDFKRNRFVEFKNDSIKKYKFIYIERGFENDTLRIRFENNHLPVK